MGMSVVDIVVENSGLPREYARQRLERLLFEAGFDPNETSLEEIREVLANLLQDLILDAE